MHRDGIEGAIHFTFRAASAAIAVVQSGEFFPALPFKGQQMPTTGSDAPSASSATRGVNIGKGST
jgi:hypothetical protein